MGSSQAMIGTSGEHEGAVGEQVRAVIGLGANVGDAPGTIARAIHALGALPGATVVAVSRLYATVPVGVTDQPEFCNAVALVDLPAGPDPEAGAVALLVALKGIERRFGRRRRGRWGPREIDLDLEAYGTHAVAVPRPPRGMSTRSAVAGGALLIVPHESARQRLFVLAPWADVAPDQEPPGWDETVVQARDRRARAEPADAVRAIGRWDADTGEWAPDGPGPGPGRARP